MSDLIRDAPVGQLLRWVTGNKILQYPEEKPGFILPTGYEYDLTSKTRHSSDSSSITPHPTEDVEKADPESRNSIDRGILERMDTARSDIEKANNPSRLVQSTTRDSALSRITTIHTRAELEHAYRTSTLAKEPSRPIEPARTQDGRILVDFYTTDDAENPQAWSLKKKALVTLVICLYTFAVYMGSAIYTPSIGGVMAEFHVGVTAASLGLALYVLAYGLGPLIFSSMSEIPIVGRNPPYVVTMGIFVALSIAAPLVQNFAGLMVIRFLQGFFGSPCLATGGASLGDLYTMIKMPYVISLWALAATCGPALGPMIAGFSVAAKNWRWSLWELLWLAAPVYILMLLFLPETSQSNILLRRAQRLRKLTGNDKYKSQSESDQAELQPRAIVFDALVRPVQLIVMDPAIGFTAVYTALIYAIYYSFFEAVPTIYIERYGFNLGEMGLVFLSITLGTVVSVAGYWYYIYSIVEPDIRANGMGKPERTLIPALFVSFLLPIGLFIFGWTGNGRIHWIVSVIGLFIFTIGIFIVIQCIFAYLPMVYPQYAASLFAGNDFARSSLAFAAVLFSRPMFHSMGIGSGISLLAAFTAACIGGVFVLFFYGEKLRARSRFAAK